jgi:hypothetical protein
MHRTKLLTYTVGLVIAAAGVSAGPLSASSSAETAKPVKPTRDPLVVTVKTSDKQFQAVNAFIRG